MYFDEDKFVESNGIYSNLLNKEGMEFLCDFVNPSYQIKAFLFNRTYIKS